MLLRIFVRRRLMDYLDDCQLYGNLKIETPMVASGHFIAQLAFQAPSRS